MWLDPIFSLTFLLASMGGTDIPKVSQVQQAPQQGRLPGPRGFWGFGAVISGHLFLWVVDFKTKYEVVLDTKLLIKTCTVVKKVMHSLSQYMCVFVVLALCTLTRGKIDHTN